MGKSIAKSSNSQVSDFLKKYDSWSLLAGKLHREYVFADFAQAFGFMTRVAIVAEKSDHHPEWSNNYKNVSIDLITHEVAGITDRDFKLAEKIESMANVA